jgi:cell division protein FtsW
MMSRSNRNGDRVLLIVIAILLALGVLMVFSASSFRGAEKYGDPARFLKSHLIRVCMGVFLLLIFAKLDYRHLRWAAPLMVLIGMVLLVGVLFGPSFQGSRRSFIILGKQFQPSEFMKLTMIFYLAAVFAKGKKSRAHQGDVLAIHYVIVLLAVGLVFIEPDLGTALVLFSVCLTMFFLAGVSWRQMFRMALFPAALFLFGIAVFPYQRQRLVDYLGSVFGSEAMSYQVEQSIIGLAFGGFHGVGFGAGKQKLFFLPEPFSDFILASLGEELGFLGLLLIFLLLLIILWRGIRIAQNAPDMFGYLLASGITMMILINALINAGVVLNLLPTTGLPFPFLSYGGSSLIAHLAGVGVLLNISKRTVQSYRGFTTARGLKGRHVPEDA